MAHPPMADPATAGTIASFAVVAILAALLVLLRPSLLVRHLLAPLLPGCAGSGHRCSAATGASSHLAHHLR